MVVNFNTRFSLPSFVKRVKLLSEDQRSAIKSMGFGYLLMIPNQTISKNLLVELMERWNCEKRAFELPLGGIKISTIDVALILGLRVVGEPVVLKEDAPFSELEKVYGSSVEKRTISMASLEKRLKSLGMMADEDFIRTFLLFTFGTFLFPNAFGTVDSRYLLFLEDLDRVPLFAWGKAVLEDLLKWMEKRKNDNTEKYMGSCLILLQIWSYEHIDIARPAMPECYLTFPRACRWQNSSYRLRQWFTTKFDELNENQIIWKLDLTSEEMKTDIIRELLETENDTIEDGMGTKTPEEHVIECEDSEFDLSKESVEVAEDNMELLSTSKYASANDKNGDEDNLRTQRKLEVEILELRKEIDDLRRENELLHKCDGDEDNLRAKEKLEEQNLEIRKEVNDLRKENELLKNQLLSLNKLADRLEKILLNEDEDIVDKLEKTVEK